MSLTGLVFPSSVPFIDVPKEEIITFAISWYVESPLVSGSRSLSSLSIGTFWTSGGAAISRCDGFLSAISRQTRMSCIALIGMLASVWRAWTHAAG